jgi:aquaporin Z
MAQLIVEFIGTFVLIFTVGMTVVDPGAGNLAPLAIGSALMVAVYAGGHISGAHYNPAVSLAVALRGRLSLARMAGYWLVQMLGALMAVAAVLFLKGGGAATAADLDPLKALVAEFIFTFVLCYVVLNVATDDETSGNSFYGLAIGFTVVAGAFAVGAISGGAFNPAVAVGIVGLGLVSVGAIWIYFVASVLAAGAAAGVYALLHPVTERTPAAAELETA